jgi:hypothetical protein
LAAIELCCLSAGAFVGELALERRAVLPCALVDPLSALAGGVGERNDRRSTAPYD